MTKNLDKEGFKSIVDNYHLFYVDLWGVVHNGVTLHKEAIKTLKEITKKKRIIFFSQMHQDPTIQLKHFWKNWEWIKI